MRSKLVKKVFDRTSSTTHQEVSDEIDNLVLKAENTEDVSSADSKSSVYTDVGECSASGEQDQPEALVEGALEKITDDGNKCDYCGGSSYDPYEYGTGIHVPCPRCN